MWSGAIDPAVVSALVPSPELTCGALRASGAEILTIATGAVRHVLVTWEANSIRVDLTCGPMLESSAGVEFRLPNTPDLSRKVATILKFRAVLAGRAWPGQSPIEQRQLQRLADRVRIADAIASGASLRTIDAVLRPQACLDDPWPGRGDHAKSRVRRQIAAARRLITGGAAAVFAPTGRV